MLPAHKKAPIECTDATLGAMYLDLGYDGKAGTYDLNSVDGVCVCSPSTDAPPRWTKVYAGKTQYGSRPSDCDAENGQY